MHRDGQTVTHGVLTYALVTLLRSKEISKLTVHEFADALAESLQWLQPHVICDDPRRMLFCNGVQEDAIQRQIAHDFLHYPLRQIIEHSRRLLVDDDKRDRELLVGISVAHAAMGQYDRAIRMLDRACKGSPEYAAAQYHLGRILLERANDEQLVPAINALMEAKKLEDERHVSTFYYLGLAIWRRAAVARNEAKSAWETYLARGAPIGRSEEVNKALDTTGS